MDLRTQKNIALTFIFSYIIVAQAGEMAAKILKGAAPSSIAPASPRKAYYVLNLKTAQQMNITFSDKILKGAHQTF